MIPFGLAEFPSLNRNLGTAIANLGGIISEDQCFDLGNLSRTRLSGKRLFKPTLAKARSGLVPMFQRPEKNWQVSWHCIRGQDN